MAPFLTTFLCKKKIVDSPINIPLADQKRKKVYYCCSHVPSIAPTSIINKSKNAHISNSMLALLILKKLIQARDVMLFGSPGILESTWPARCMVVYVPWWF